MGAQRLWDSQMAALGGTQVYSTLAGEGSTSVQIQRLKNKDSERWWIKMRRERTCNSDIRDRQKQEESRSCQSVQGWPIPLWVSIKTRALAVQA